MTKFSDKLPALLVLALSSFFLKACFITSQSAIGYYSVIKFSESPTQDIETLNLMAILAYLPVGFIVDKTRSYKSAIVTGGLIIACANLLIFYPDSYETFRICYGVTFLGESIVQVGLVSVLAARINTETWVLFSSSCSQL